MAIRAPQTFLPGSIHQTRGLTFELRSDLPKVSVTQSTVFISCNKSPFFAPSLKPVKKGFRWFPAAINLCRPSKPIQASLASQSNLTAGDLELRAKLDSFEQWLATDGGVNLSSFPVKLAKVPEGLGLVATKNISSSDEIFFIPDSTCISLDSVLESSIGPLCNALKPWVSVSLYLIKEKHDPNSKWKPYLDILPSEPELPIFWSDEELSELQGTQVLNNTFAYKEFVSSEFNNVLETVIKPHPDLFNEKVFSLDEFLWAFGIIRSRTFPPCVGNSLALVPFADMVNHGNSNIVPESAVWKKQTKGLFGGKNGIYLKSGREYKAGEQVFMEYGIEKSNSQLALDYGFADPGQQSDREPDIQFDLDRRSRDCFSLSLELSPSDRFYDDKSDVAEINGLETSMDFDLVAGEGPSEIMLAFLRLIALGGSDAFLLEALFRSTVWNHMKLPVSKDNEEAICQAIIDGCTSALSEFTTSIEEDLRLLKAGGLNGRKRTAVIARLSEKQVLNELLDWFQARLEGLENLEYYAERRLKDLGLLDDNSNMTPWVFPE